MYCILVNVEVCTACRSSEWTSTISGFSWAHAHLVFLKQPRPTCLKVVLPTVNWVLLYQPHQWRQSQLSFCFYCSICPLFYTFEKRSFISFETHYFLLAMKTQQPLIILQTSSLRALLQVLMVLPVFTWVLEIQYQCPLIDTKTLLNSAQSNHIIILLSLWIDVSAT